MSYPPSFERFNYLLRTNKHIERRLVFDLLQDASTRGGFPHHWYLGFGSMWFGDFRLADRQLGIHDMISIERDQAARAEYNRPFGGIKVIDGISGTAIKAFNAERWSKPVIAWLDYDGALTEDVVDDIDVLLANAITNSVVIVTLNAVRNTYRPRVITDGERPREQTAVGTVEGLLGSNCIAPRFEPSQNRNGKWIDISEGMFPEFLTDALSTYFQHKLTSLARVQNNTQIHFSPLFLIHHKDGSDMVTVGGAITPNMEDDVWKKSLLSQSLLSGHNKNAEFLSLDLIPLTIKEKIALDTCLPVPHSDQEFLTLAKAVGLKLSDDDMKKYRRFYRHFPMFVETPL